MPHPLRGRFELVDKNRLEEKTDVLRRFSFIGNHDKCNVKSVVSVTTFQVSHGVGNSRPCGPSLCAAALAAVLRRTRGLSVSPRHAFRCTAVRGPPAH